ncbi:NUDIX domain-containing protein [Sporolactobacillus sp. THM7-7]|nr:NUDIX domain-containing protein [Sporolactobacillus sp. THM7-7]
MGYIQKLRAKVGLMPVILVGCVGILLDREGRVLLQQRKERSRRWGLPGGLMELGESCEETLKREVYEETHLTVCDVRLFHVFSGEANHVIADNGDEFYAVTCAYVCDTYQGTPERDAEETLDLRFFDIDKLPDHMVGSQRRILKAYQECKAQG